MKNLKKFEVINNLALEALKGGAKAPVNPDGDCRETSPGLWDIDASIGNPDGGGFTPKRVRKSRK